MSLSLAEKLTLWKWLSEALATVHKKVLVPDGQAQMTPGERLAVKFAGELVAWVSLPKPTQPSTRVKDPAKFLAWAKVHHAEKIEYPVEVIVDAGLIEYLQEHRPQSLRPGERVDPQWAEDICTGLDGRDHRFVCANGDVLTEVPGIERPDASPSSPRVNLEDGAAEVIARAWPQIQPALREVLALPAPPQEVTGAA
jgi:hypothetical protein